VSRPEPPTDCDRPSAPVSTSRRRFLTMAAIFAAALPALGSRVLGAVTGTTSKGAPPDDSGQPRRLRRWAMVIDLRSCDGCQSEQKPPQCTAACIQGHYVPEPMQWLQVYERPLPGGGTQFLPTPCQHCQNAPCVNVCPVGATFATPEGTVLIDQRRCIGCRMCMAACPYDRRFFNWGDPIRPPETAFLTYSPENQFGAPRGTVMKCDFCPDEARAGSLPFCVRGCPQGALWWGDLEEDLATNGKEVIVLSRLLADHDASRLKEHLGTEPRVYYIHGHGERLGRSPYRRGRLATRWPWKALNGATAWKRSGR